MAFLELTFPGGHKTKSSLRGFEIDTDYPKYLGGDESAPAPWHIFLASLASCQGIHIRNYCAEYNLPYEKIKITLEPIASANDPDWFTDFNLEVHLPEGFPEEHIEPMLAAAKSCRVVKHLCVHPVRVNSTAVMARE
jgi:uncharacterized OsmC-like protein